MRITTTEAERLLDEALQSQARAHRSKAISPALTRKRDRARAKVDRARAALAEAHARVVARDVLGIESLDVVGSDREDFVALGKASIAHALVLAFDLGVRAGRDEIGRALLRAE